MIKTYCAITTLVLFSFSIYAQKGIVSGVLVDTSKLPIAGVSITLQEVTKTNGAQKNLSTHVFSDERGKFTFSSVIFGRHYILRTKVTGKSPMEYPFFVPLEAQNFNLDTIVIQDESNMIGEVVVKASPKIVDFKSDRIIYHVDKDPDKATNSLPEMMQRIPMLTLGMDDKIEIKGKANYKVLINGRSNHTSAGNASEILKTIPPSLVKRVEVILSPGSRYDAEGTVSSVINIVTTNRANGYNGSIGFVLNSIGRYSQNLAISAKKGKLGIMGFSTLGDGKMNTSSKFERENYYEQTLYKETRSGSGANRNAFQSGSFEVSFEPDSLATYSLHGTFLGFNVLDQTSSEHLGIDRLAEILEKGLYEELTSSRLQDWSLGGDYIQRFKKKGQELAILSAYNNKISRNGILYDRIFEIGQQDAYNKQNSYLSEIEKIIDLNYTHPLQKGDSWSTGGKFIGRSFTNDYNQMFKSVRDASYVTVPAMTGIFNYHQQVLAFYGEYEKDWRMFSTKFGIRYEYTNSTGQLEGNINQYKNHYGTLFPSFGLSWSSENDRQHIYFHYTRKIARPNLHFLNPQQNFNNPRNAFSGNPYLDPEFIHNIDLNWTYAHNKKNINLNLDYGLSNNLINDVNLLDSLRGTVLSTFRNTGQKEVLGMNILYADALGSKTRFTLNGRMAHETVSGYIGGILYKNKGITGNINLNISHKMPQTWSLQGNFIFRLGDLALQGRNNIWYSYQFSVGKSLLKTKKLRLTLSISQPFEPNRKTSEKIQTPFFRTAATDILPVRAIQLRANWRFGALKENVSRKRGTDSTDKKTQNGPPE